MASIPLNLTLIREDFQKPRSLSQIKASMGAAPTDYVMVVGINDIIDVTEPLTGGVHYLATRVATRRAFRHFRPVLAYDPILWTQVNYAGMPILHRSLVPLFPETSVEPWHTVMVRAQTQGASISLVAGDHTIVEPWPRPELTGAYSRFRHSFSAEAIMEAVPAILVEEIDQQPYYSLRDPRAGSVRVFCRNCSDEFVTSLAALNVTVETIMAYDHDRILTSNTDYVAWFDGIVESTGRDSILSQLQLALEFPNVIVASPHVVSEFTPASFYRPAFTVMGINQGFEPTAWMSRTRDVGASPPNAGFHNSQAILRKIT